MDSSYYSPEDRDVLSESDIIDAMFLYESNYSSQRIIEVKTIDELLGLKPIMFQVDNSKCKQCRESGEEARESYLKEDEILWHYREHLPPKHHGCKAEVILFYGGGKKYRVVPWYLYKGINTYKITVKNWSPNCSRELQVGRMEEWDKIKAELNDIYDQWFDQHAIPGMIDSMNPLHGNMREKNACRKRAETIEKLFNNYLHTIKKCYWCVALTGYFQPRRNPVHSYAVLSLTVPIAINSAIVVSNASLHAIVKVIARIECEDGVQIEEELYDPWLSIKGTDRWLKKQYIQIIEQIDNGLMLPIE